VRYVSTRGRAPELGFADVLLAGLATDGGLYVPDTWPQLPAAETLDACATYADAAAAILTPFVGDAIAGDELASMCTDAYATFRHAAVVPLVQVGHRHWLAELFHGPTLAFKDVALQLVGRLFDHVLAERGARVTVVGATSGDTGPAAIEGVRGCDRVDIVILYPQGGTSEVQRRQMTTVDAPNVRAVAVDGTFDDCQDLVKAMFNDAPFRQRHNLSAVNSINWARVMAQAVYFVTTARALRGEVTACVPTGNFGNLFAGWVARRMGAPIRDFIVSSNANDILTRFINEGDMSMRPVVTTTSPSMDIQVSSNFERLLFEINGRDGLRTGEQLIRFRQSGRLDVAAEARAAWVDGHLRAARFDDDEVASEIGRMYADSGVLIDPHTATAAAAARHFGDSNGDVPIVTMAAAHPAKFPDVVERATGVRPALPPHLADLYEREERSELLPNDLAAVEDYVAVTFR
jgi:threonine synthase